ncbi:MAG: L-fucose:H+ symporter permease [Bacteroidetes bacterium]|nr:L-fucose:H+ symporter permease [Bacteroidota bacterium]
MAAGLPSSNLKSTYVEGQSYKMPLIVVTNLFFIWAFVTNLNDVLIPYLKKACDLSDFQSSLVQFSFFIAYFIMSIPSASIIKRVGYKRAMLIGLLCMLLGALLFIPAAITGIYFIFLAALFILASGVTLLQVAANPYVAILGKPETASARLNLTQAFNSLGATIGPWIGGTLILSALTDEEFNLLSEAQKLAIQDEQSSMVVLTYVGLAAVILLISAIIYFSKLPEIGVEEEETTADVADDKTTIFTHKHLLLGVISIFLYVGAEVAIGSFIIRLAGDPAIGGLTELEGKNFVSYYMFFAMVGRFAGSYFLSKISPSKVVGFNALVAVALLFVGVFTSGSLALYSIVLIGLCNSIMFPTIFTLAIKDLGSFAKQGSSYLVMAIVGGAFVPPLMGYVSGIKGIQMAFLVPVACYIFIAYYGFKGSKVTTLPAHEGSPLDLENAESMAKEISL